MKHQVKRIGAFALIVAVFWSSSANAILQDLNLQTQLQWRTLDLTSRDGSVSSIRGASTNYNLSLRQPPTPWATLAMNLSINSLANTDQFGKQQNSTMVFNLSSYERTHSLTMGFVRNGYRSVLTSGGQLAVATGNDRSYDLNFFMREPSYPTFNFQLRRRLSQIGASLGSSSSQITSWLAGTYYEMAPFRFSMDGSKQTISSTGALGSSAVTNRRMALNFDQTIISGLNLSGELSKDWSDLDQTGRSSRKSTRSAKSIRFTAMPTPSMVINGDAYARDSTQTFAGVATPGSSSGSRISILSEVMPGLTLNVSKAHDLRTDVNRIALSDNVSANMSAILAPDVILGLSHSRDTQSIEPQAISSRSTFTTASLAMPTGTGMDLTLDAGRSASSGTVGSSFNSSFIGATLRGRLADDATASVAYRHSKFSTGGLSVTNQRTDTVDFDVSWLPTGSLGLNARVNYYLNSGSNISEFISPYIDMRWTPNSISSVTMRYNFSKSRQWDWLQNRFIAQGDKGASLRLTQQLSRKSTLDLTYDFQGTDLGELQSQRSLQVLFTYKL